MPLRLSALVLFAIASCLPSCVTFEGGETPGLDRWPPAANSGKWLHVTMDGLPRKFARGWERGVKRELENSDCFRGVEVIDRTTSMFAEAEAHLHLQFTHSRQDLWTTRIWMGVCAMTATVVPARTEQFFDVRAVVTDAKGKELGVVERSVYASTWVGILTLLALPFEGAGNGEMVRDTIRSIVVEATDNGWL